MGITIQEDMKMGDKVVFYLHMATMIAVAICFGYTMFLHEYTAMYISGVTWILSILGLFICIYFNKLDELD